MISQVSRDLCHEVAAGVRGDASNLNHTRGVMDHEEHIVSDQPSLRPQVYGEEVIGETAAASRGPRVTSPQECDAGVSLRPALGFHTK